LTAFIDQLLLAGEDHGRRSRSAVFELEKIDIPAREAADEAGEAKMKRRRSQSWTDWAAKLKAAKAKAEEGGRPGVLAAVLVASGTAGSRPLKARREHWMRVRTAAKISEGRRWG
jgi:hypothetical protein